MKKRNRRPATDLLIDIVELLKKHSVGLTISIIAKQLKLSWEITDRYLACLLKFNIIRTERLGERTIYIFRSDK